MRHLLRRNRSSSIRLDPLARLARDLAGAAVLVSQVLRVLLGVVAAALQVRRDHQAWARWVQQVQQDRQAPKGQLVLPGQPEYQELLARLVQPAPKEALDQLEVPAQLELPDRQER